MGENRPKARLGAVEIDFRPFRGYRSRGIEGVWTMSKMGAKGAVALFMCLAVTAASAQTSVVSGAQTAANPLPIMQASVRPTARPAQAKLPALRWDHVKGAPAWTRAAMRALGTHGAPLLSVVPDDIAQWCPAYPQAEPWARKAFWAGLLSTLAKHESTYRPNVVGGGGKWVGLVQILPATARGYGCKARTREALKDGAANMSCAVRIMAETVPRDGVVSAGMKGVAADWGPFHSRSKREDMRRWLATRPFCKAPVDLASLAPVPRQGVIVDTAGLDVRCSARDDAASVAPTPMQRPDVVSGVVD